MLWLKSMDKGKPAKILSWANSTLKDKKIVVDNA